MGAPRVRARRRRNCQEVLAGDGVESGARLVEDHELRRGHQGSANEDALAFALGKKSPRTIAERAGLDAAQDCSGGAAVVGADLAPVANLCITTADDGFESRFAVVGLHHLMHAGTDQSDPARQIAPVKAPVSFAEHANFPGGRRQVSGQRAEQGSFTGAVGAENRPMLAAFDAPIDGLQDDGLALDAQGGHLDHGRMGFHGETIFNRLARVNASRVESATRASIHISSDNFPDSHESSGLNCSALCNFETRCTMPLDGRPHYTHRR